MTKIFSLLIISTSVFYPASINAHKYKGIEDHPECVKGRFLEESAFTENWVNKKHYGYKMTTLGVAHGIKSKAC